MLELNVHKTFEIWPELHFSTKKFGASSCEGKAVRFLRRWQWHWQPSRKEPIAGKIEGLTGGSLVGRLA